MFVKTRNIKKIFLGIDLGTTYSLAATVQEKNIFLSKDDKKRYLFPSIIHYKKNTIYAGWKAEKYLIKDPINTISSVKRIIGRSLNFIQKNFPNLPYSIKKKDKNSVYLNTNFGLVTPTDVSGSILKCLKTQSELFFEKKIYASVITVPAYFNNFQKIETQKAADLSKMNLIRLLSEPTSAALAYSLTEQKKEIVLVYDLGGGTFDVSILKLNQGIFQVLATSGDSNLGGDDFDLILANYIYKKSKMKNQYNIFFSLLIKIAKETKLKLTIYNSVNVCFLNWTGKITRNEFNSMIMHLIEKTLLICSDIMKEIDLSKEKINSIVMVGGSTRVPLVYKTVAHFFKNIPLNSIHPDQVVAIGAAMQANMLLSDRSYKKTILLDVIPISLGIEVIGGFVEKIIPRNTPIPISKTKFFTTSQDNQTSILIHVVQGEKQLARECISLSRFSLKDIYPQKAGSVMISVNFHIDTDGVINIKVLDKNSNKSKTIKIDHDFSIG